MYYLFLKIVLKKLINTQSVDIKLSAHDAFLEKSTSGTLKIERLESQMTQCLGAIKPKDLNRNITLDLKRQFR
jgi:hypothetical protein